MKAGLFLILALLIMSCTDSTETNSAPTADAAFTAPLGIQLWSFREAAAEDPRAMLEMAHEFGFTHVETAGFYGMGADSVADMLQDVGLEPTSMHVSYEELRDQMEQVIADARSLSVQYVGTAWYPHAAPFTEETARQAIADFNTFGAALKEVGLQFFYHPHGYEPHPYGDETLLDLIIDETDPELVAYELDVLWTWLPGLDPVALIARHPGRFKLMHIKDMKPGLERGSLSGGLPAEDQSVIGQGQVDWPALLQAAQADGFDHYYLEDETPDPKTNAPLSVAYLNSLRD